MKIGVFDSGLGGLSVANAIKEAMPGHEVIFRNDKEHVPYGTKPPQQLISYVVPIIEDLAGKGCDVIVIACNTVSTTLINELRAYSSIPLVAIEPMVKPASEITKTGVIAVCATPTTLASNRYQRLKEDYASDKKLIEPDCSDWSAMIENDELNRDIIESRIQEVLEQNADVIVLACTHYHWIESEILKVAKGKASVLQPEQAIIKQLTRVLSQL